MSPKTAKNGRSRAVQARKLRSEIEQLRARLSRLQSKFEELTEFEVRDAGKMLDALLARVEGEGERLYLCRGGRRVAAIVPADEGEYLETMEERHWTRAADQAMQEPGSIPSEQVKKELGL